MYIPQASRPLWFWLFCSFWSEASFGTQRVQRRGFSRNGRQGPGRSHPHWDWWWWAHPWSPHHPPAPRCQHLSGTPGSKNRSFYVCDLEKNVIHISHHSHHYRHAFLILFGIYECNACMYNTHISLSPSIVCSEIGSAPRNRASQT